MTTPHKRLIPPSQNNKGDGNNQPSKKARISAVSSSIELAPRKPTSTIGGDKVRGDTIIPPSLNELQSFIVEIYKEIGLDGSKTILATASTTPVSSLETVVQETRTTLAPANTTTTRTTIPAAEANITAPNNNVEVDFATVEASKLNRDAFNFTKNGAQRSALAARKASSRATSNIMDAIASVGSKDQQALALRKACLHPSMVEVTKTAGLAPSSTSEETRDLLLDGIKNTYKEVLGEGTKKRSNMDRVTFAEILSGSLIGSGASVLETSRLLELDESRCRRLFSKGEVRVENAMNETGKWSYTRPNKGYSKITTAIKEKLDIWIREHPNVRPSPITRDTLLIRNKATGEKERVGKLLLEIPVRDLHNDMLLPVNKGGFAGAFGEDGAIIISDTTLRKLLPRELRPATETHKQLCGCELCITAASLQKTLNAFRLRSLKVLKERSELARAVRARLPALRQLQEYRASVANVDETLKQKKASDALTLMTCPNVGDTEFPPWNCVLGNCCLCPSYKVPRYEDNENDDAPRINYVTYEKQSRCTVHGVLPLEQHECFACTNAVPGTNDVNTDDTVEERKKQSNKKVAKVVTKKFPTLRCAKIGHFVRHIYLPVLVKCRYHFAHKKMLSKLHCYNERHKWYEESSTLLKMHRDYAEPISQEKDMEIQSDHFGYVPSCSIEGVCVWSAVPDSIASFDLGTLPLADVDRTMKFHSHLSDHSKQDAATTHAHMCVLLNKLKESGEVVPRRTTILDHSNGCSKQYRCGTSIYLLLVLSSQFGVTVDRMIGAPGHGKDVVDALNATTKKYIKQKMRMVSNPGSDECCDRKMKVHSVSETESTSFAMECLRLCSLQERKDGVKSSSKYAKREQAAPVSERLYYLQKREDVRLGQLKMALRGLPKGAAHSGLLARYNIRTDPDLGVGRAALRRIPCSCQACRIQLGESWAPRTPIEEQRRYQENVDCRYWQIFKGLNDWLIVDLCPSAGTDMDDVQEACYDVIEGLCEQMSQAIKIGQTGAIGTEDMETQGYYLVRWETEAYRFAPNDEQESEIDNLPQLEEGDLVVRGKYHALIKGAPFWYSPPSPDDDDDSVLVRVQTVLSAEVELHPVEEGLYDPPRNKRRTIEKVKGSRILEVDHLDLLEEIVRRERIDQEETIVEEQSDVEDGWSTDDASNDDVGEDEEM